MTFVMIFLVDYLMHKSIIFFDFDLRDLKIVRLKDLIFISMATGVPYILMYTTCLKVF